MPREQWMVAHPSHVARVPQQKLILVVLSALELSDVFS